MKSDSVEEATNKKLLLLKHEEVPSLKVGPEDISFYVIFIHFSYDLTKIRGVLEQNY